MKLKEELVDIEEALEGETRKLIKKVIRVETEIRKTTATALAVGFAFLMALVWRDFIEAALLKVLADLNITADAYLFNFIFALLITFICIVAIFHFSRWAHTTPEAPKSTQETKIEA